MIQYTKGAPDEVLKRCTSVWKEGKEVPMTEELRGEILNANKKMADQALRVLCAARRNWDRIPESCEPEALEQELCYLGLSGMIDPVRPEVIPAHSGVPEITAATIRIMIMGSFSSIKNLWIRLSFLPSFSLFFPHCSSRREASAELKPLLWEFCWRSTSSVPVRYSFIPCSSFLLKLPIRIREFPPARWIRSRPFLSKKRDLSASADKSRHFIQSQDLSSVC